MLEIVCLDNLFLVYVKDQFSSYNAFLRTNDVHDSLGQPSYKDKYLDINMNRDVY